MLELQVNEDVDLHSFILTMSCMFDLILVGSILAIILVVVVVFILWIVYKKIRERWVFLMMYLMCTNFTVSI